MNTVTQAAALWCPMVRAANGQQATNCTVNVPIDRNEHVEPVHWDTCQGDRCAMWRWAEGPVTRDHVFCFDGSAETEPPRPPHVPATWGFIPCGDDPACWVEPEEGAAERRRGYCGLAGAPIHG